MLTPECLAHSGTQRALRPAGHPGRLELRVEPTGAQPLRRGVPEGARAQVRHGVREVPGDAPGVVDILRVVR